ncbi:MAG: GvpL/GvpF family gas vesicle protein [Ardenticatenaceae bacterium]|nr:GvpL/GvpF family gas vesicle protein [Ardenticatenaceae bacterium]HBY96870.1 hypothetical protein [Chloroflexota bacterium]
MAATYIYAVIPGGVAGIFDVAGVDDGDGDVYAVPYHDLAAVVSSSPLPDYRGLRREDAVRYLVAHQRVIEAVMQAFPVLPVKFGTVLPNETRVRHLLAQGEALFRTTLEQFAGQMQMEVVVLWDLSEIFQEIGREEAIIQLKAQVAARPVEETPAERVAIGQIVKASLDRRRAALCQRLLPPLQEVALDLVVNPLMDESMVANVALLVDEAGGRLLDEQLAMLDERFEGRLHFRCVGPLPPNSFATVEVQGFSFESVNEARYRLGLGETSSLGEIKKNYHRLAAQLHPDHNPQDPEAEARMAELTWAYRHLIAYGETQAVLVPDEQGCGEAQGLFQGTPAREPVCSFTCEAVEQALLIAIRRQEILA